MAQPIRSPFPFAVMALAACALFAGATPAAATCDEVYTTRIGAPAMAQPNGAFQTVAGNCTGTAGCSDFFDIALQGGDTLELSFCNNGGTANFDTDLTVRSGFQFQDPEDCESDVCGSQAEVSLVASSTGTYRVRIGYNADLPQSPADGSYTLAYSAPAGRLIVPASCGDGTLDAGEQCDDGNDLAGDCCSPSCEFEASGDSCPDDGNSCTDEQCDGAGTCTHPDKLVGETCDDEGNDCTDNVCDGAGTCDHPNRAAGEYCDDGEGVFCTADACDGAGTCTHTVVPYCADMLPVCGPKTTGGSVQFEHPKLAKKFDSDLVQAFLGCNNAGGGTPDRTTEGGVPACEPETADDRDANPTTGWHWDNTKAYGRVTVYTRCPGAADFGIKLRLYGITDGNGAPVNATGTMAMVVRLTVVDPVGGDMTTIDYPLEFAFHVLDGVTLVQTSANAMLSDQNLPPLPNGTSVEFAGVDLNDGGLMEIRDENGNPFARPGVFLPLIP